MTEYRITPEARRQWQAFPALLDRWRADPEYVGPPDEEGNRAPHPPDAPLPGGEERPCSRCGRPFRPTLRRRMLCAACFAGPDAARVMEPRV